MSQQGRLRIVAIDVGYSSLGMVCVEVGMDSDPTTIVVIFADKIDLRDIPCQEGCTLAHSANVVDRITHFVRHYEAMLTGADRLLIEAQPITGLRDVQALLYDRFRSKTTLVHPTSMHKHFGLSGDYDTRKVQTVSIASPFLAHSVTFARLHRKHDIADAFCMVLYVTQRAHHEHVMQKQRDDIMSRAAVNRMNLSLDRFKCTASLVKARK